VTVATYQSVSGAGQKGLDELDAGLSQDPAVRGEVFAHPIAFEALPHCGTLDSDGWTSEERKLMVETRRILERPDLPVSATAVRVPVRRSHSEAVWVETEEPIDAAQARALWRAAPGIEVIDEPENARYPRARHAAGTDPVYVGRIRRDPADSRGLAFWVVADNVRKGAALNAIQILEQLIGAKPAGLGSRTAHDRG
jgi:aspartate-semialdehyde dehydrogenase